jgi:pentatricopeptide repeat protein
LLTQNPLPLHSVISHPKEKQPNHSSHHGAATTSSPTATAAGATLSVAPIACAAALLPTARLLRGRMGYSSAAAAAFAVLPAPSPSSSDDSDDANTLPTNPIVEPEVASPHQTPPPKLQQLERGCNLAMTPLGRAGDVDQVVHLFSDLMLSTSSAGVPPSVLCYNTLLNALVEAGRAVEARSVFDGMLAAGVAPNASSFNILVKLYAWRTADFHLAYDQIHAMRRHGLLPDVGTFSTLVTGLCRAGKLDEAWGVLDWMLQEGCRPMVHTYTPIVQGYCRQGQIEEATNLIGFMEDAGCPPNAVTYNVLIRALCDDARFAEVEQVLAEIETKGHELSTVTYNIYMDALGKKGMAKEALKQFEALQCKGLHPTAFTLSIILNCLCCTSRFSQAISILERSTDLNFCAAVVAYNTVMSRLCDMGRWPAVLELLADMIKKCIIPNTRTLNIFIHSLCIADKLSVAMKLVCNQGFPANAVTYNTLIHSFYLRGEAYEADNMFAYMTEVANIAPDEVTYTIMVDGLCRQGKFDKATDFFKESLRNRLRLSKDLLTALLNGLARSDRNTNILVVFQEIERQGFVRCYLIFGDTVRSICQVGFRQHTKMYGLPFLLEGMLGPGKEVYPAHKGQGKGK